MAFYSAKVDYERYDIIAKTDFIKDKALLNKQIEVLLSATAQCKVCDWI
jgi:hypothetical protein